MKVKTVGYYKEMPHGKNSKESICEYVNKEDTARIDNICKYLESGIEFIISPGIAEDVINPDKGYVGTTSTYTDGIWFWPADLSYYVRNYRLKLPEEFVQTMEQGGWKVSISFDDLDCSIIEVDGKIISEDN